MKPLTIEQLKSLEVGDWVWIIDFEKTVYKPISDSGKYFQIHYTGQNTLQFYNGNNDLLVLFSDYGTKWLAYKNKEQAECKGEIVELPCKEELKNIIFYSCNREGHAKHCPERIAEAVYEYLKDQVEARLQELRGEK